MNEKEARLKQLNNQRYLSDQEVEEREKLIEELNLTEDQAKNLSYHEFRKKRSELDKLIGENNELEFLLKLKKERERNNTLKNKLDGKIYCDDCHKWVYPSHFD